MILNLLSQFSLVFLVTKKKGGYRIQNLINFFRFEFKRWQSCEYYAVNKSKIFESLAVF